MEKRVFEGIAKELWRIESVKDSCNYDKADEIRLDAIEKIEALEKRLPSGSGFDAGSHIDMVKSRSSCIVITTEYHHLSEYGYYCGWSSHAITVSPSMVFGFVIDCKSDYIGVDKEERRDIKAFFEDYILDCFQFALSEVI